MCGVIKKDFKYENSEGYTITFYKPVMVSTDLSGCEIWMMRESDKERIKVYKMRILERKTF